MHRDIKPENLFLTTEGRLKLLDFGVARMTTEVGATPTNNGEMLGTPAYMSPEQARGHTDSVGPHSDLWSLAATAVALISGRAPRQASTVNEVLLLAMTKPMDAVASLCPMLSAEVCAVLDRALLMEPAARYASAAAMRAALSAASAVPTAAPEVTPYGGQRPTSRPLGLGAGAGSDVRGARAGRRRVVAASFVAVAAVGVAIWMQMRVRQDVVQSAPIVQQAPSVPSVHIAREPSATPVLESFAPALVAPVAPSPSPAVVAGKPATRKVPSATAPVAAPPPPTLQPQDDSRFDKRH